MENQDFLLEKIWGSWTGKIAGGTFGMPVEGKRKNFIQNYHPSLSGWTKIHKQAVNDDEQYELISLLALEDLNDAEFSQRFKSGKILEPDYLGSYWLKHLLPQYVFTAEKAAFDNAKIGVPWEHAGDYMYQHEGKIFGNEFADWIGAQMKGELYGMLLPAWGWYDKTAKYKDSYADLNLLKPCLDLSLQDSLIAHRDVGIVGELFISAMISVAITHNQFDYKEEIKYAGTEFTRRELDPTSPSGLKEIPEKHDGFKEEINQIGICAETIISDIRRIKDVLIKYASLVDSITVKDVELYFSFIDPIIENFENNPVSSDWGKVWRIIYLSWWKFEGEMVKNAISEFKNYPELLEKRMQSIRYSVNVHTLFNNSAIVIGLLYGDGDFMQTVRISTECGYDTDCNAGNAGAIIGAYLGQDLIPSYVKRFIRGEIIPGLKEWTDKSLFNLSKRTLAQALRFKKFVLSNSE